MKRTMSASGSETSRASGSPVVVSTPPWVRPLDLDAGGLERLPEQRSRRERGARRRPAAVPARGRRRARRAAATRRCRSSAASPARSGARRTRTRPRSRRRRRGGSPRRRPRPRGRRGRTAPGSDRRSRAARGRRARRRRRAFRCPRPRCGSGSRGRAGPARRRRRAASDSRPERATRLALRSKTTAPVRRSIASAAVRAGSTCGTASAFASRVVERRVGGARRCSDARAARRRARGMGRGGAEDRPGGPCPAPLARLIIEVLWTIASPG